MVIAGVIVVAVAAALLIVVTRPSHDAVSSHRASAAEQPGVSVRRTRLGPVLVNAQSHTLYLFVKDVHPVSTCYGSCARVWPPAFVSGPVRAGGGVLAEKLAITTRRDGRRQLVYNGHPLYAMSGDARPGDTAGEGFLGTWFAVSPAGERVVQPGVSTSPGDY